MKEIKFSKDALINKQLLNTNKLTKLEKMQLEATIAQQQEEYIEKLNTIIVIILKQSRDIYFVCKRVNINGCFSSIQEALVHIKNSKGSSELSKMLIVTEPRDIIEKLNLDLLNDVNNVYPELKDRMLLTTDNKLSQVTDNHTVTVYTDGSIIDNGHAGWGVYYNSISSGETLISGSEKIQQGANSLEAEAIAVIRAIEFTRDRFPNIEIVCDNMNVVKVINNTIVPKSKICIYLRSLIDKLKGSNNISAKWVRGHSSHIPNEVADELSKAINNIRKEILK